MKIEEAIGANMARLREEAGLSQKQLGEALGAYLGKTWTRQAVSAAEKGRRAFTAAELVSLALVLRTSMDFLLLLPVRSESLGDLLPGKAEIARDDLESAIVGGTEGAPSARALFRAHGALVAAMRDQLDAQKALSDSLVRQALLLDHAAVALGITNELLGPELLQNAGNDDENEGDQA